MVLSAAVARDSRGEQTFALVTCQATGAIRSAGDLRRALTGAVTEYLLAHRTDPGTARSVNIGDVVDLAHDPDFVTFLEAWGLSNFSCEVARADTPNSGWSFDEHLNQPRDLCPDCGRNVERCTCGEEEPELPTRTGRAKRTHAQSYQVNGATAEDALVATQPEADPTDPTFELVDQQTFEAWDVHGAEGHQLR